MTQQLNGQTLDCGVVWWRPRWLQRYATVRNFLYVYGLLGTTQTMAFVYFIITLTTLERRFKIPSGTTGIVLSGNEISQIMLSLVLSYIGGRRHRPRWIAGGGVISAISCLILAMAHFIFGPGEEAIKLTREFVASQHSGGGGGAASMLLRNSTAVIPGAHRLCSVVGTAAATAAAAAVPDECNATVDLSTVLPLVLIFMSQFVLGVGTTMYYTLGTSYLDDGVQKSNTPMMLAYALSFRMGGLIIGFGLVHVSLNMYIDPWSTPLIEASDPRWLGAYWFGWLVLFVVMLAASFMAGLFPRVMPKLLAVVGTDNNDAQYAALPVREQPQMMAELTSSIEKTTVAPPDENDEAEEDFLHGFGAALLRLLRNKLLMCNNIANVFYLLGSSAYITFIAKYMEVQFNRDSTNATMISGPVSILSTLTGLLLSGWLITKYRPKPRKLFAWNLIVGAIGMGGLMCNLYLTCDSGAVIGDAAAIQTLRTACNTNCSCAGVSYSPVCDERTGRTYYSPCHAGCVEWSDERREYGGCGCGETSRTVERAVAASQLKWGDDRDDLYATDDSYEDYGDYAKATTMQPEANLYTMIPGACAAGCAAAFLLYTIISGFISWLGATARIGNILLSFRAVPVADKSLAQGLGLWMISLLALIPGPIIFGYIIDGTCLVWNTDRCTGERGNCQLYDQTLFRWSINVVSMAFSAVGVTFDALVWWHGKDVDLYGDRDDAADDDTVDAPEKA